MLMVYPDYYENFKCTAEKCRHNCCIGWEIDIDKESLAFYNSVPGDFGNRLKANISWEGTPHFILDKNERCPFLNNKSLCDIFTELGENRLCQICSDHPRFYNELETHTEAGLGLCCEEAARLIITKKSPVKLLNLPDSNNSLLIIRDMLFEILQNRGKTIDQRITDIARFFAESSINTDISKILTPNVSEFFPLFESLERLSEDWSKHLMLAKSVIANNCSADFDSIITIENRETEYEQLLCYLLYRHLPKAEFIEDTVLYTCFAIVVYRIIRAIGFATYVTKEDFTIADQIEIVRLFSSEIEYSDKNLDVILNFLETEIFGYCNDLPLNL